MKSMMRYAALMVALVMVLGWAQVVRPGVAGANEDVELLQPPTTKGDPDDGGPSRIFRLKLSSWSASTRRALTIYRVSMSSRTNHRSPQASSNAGQPWTRQR